MCPASWNSRSLPSTTVCPRWMSGAVGSIPSFTRSGRRRASCSASAPCGQHVDRVARQAPGLLAEAAGDPRWVAHRRPGRGGRRHRPNARLRPRLGGRSIAALAQRASPACGSPARRRAVRTVNRWPHHDANSLASEGKARAAGQPWRRRRPERRALARRFADTSEIEFDFSGDPEFIPGRPLRSDPDQAPERASQTTATAPPPPPFRDAPASPGGWSGSARPRPAAPERSTGERRRRRQGRPAASSRRPLPRPRSPPSATARG